MNSKGLRVRQGGLEEDGVSAVKARGPSLRYKANFQEHPGKNSTYKGGQRVLNTSPDTVRIN